MYLEERVLKKKGGDVEVVVLDGFVPDDALSVLLGSPTVGRRTVIGVLAGPLERLGYGLRTNVAVRSRGDGHGGRIALVARRGDEVLAIEQSDRVKSRAKLESFAEATARVIVRAA
jgi:hypothetical protein